jgi:hypothetical protein
VVVCLNKSDLKKDAEIMTISIANFLWAGLGYVMMRMWWGIIIMIIYFMFSYTLFFYAINYPVIMILSFCANLGFAFHAGFLAFLKNYH